MTESEIKQNAYYEAKKKKIIDSLQAKDAQTLCDWSDSIFFNTFETPSEQVDRLADKFQLDITPF